MLVTTELTFISATALARYTDPGSTSARKGALPTNYFYIFHRFRRPIYLLCYFRLSYILVAVVATPGSVRTGQVRAGSRRGGIGVPRGSRAAGAFNFLFSSARMSVLRSEPLIIHRVVYILLMSVLSRKGDTSAPPYVSMVHTKNTAYVISFEFDRME